MRSIVSGLATQVASDVAARRRSAVEVATEALQGIDARNPALNAFLETLREHALARASAIDAAIAAGRNPGPLAGVPVAVKDNICTRFGRTTCASRILADYRSPYDAAVVERIENAGGIIVGKTNLDEFAMGSSTENSAAGPARNPWDRSRVTGGSSGGSAAAVAARLVPLALGSDTGGSIRQPAAFCNVVGLKPTYGRVSRFGLIAYGSSLDQIGPLATSVTDAALLLDVIAGPDPRDSTCSPQPAPPVLPTLSDPALREFAQSLRIGIPREYFSEGLDTDVAATIQDAIKALARAGAKFTDVSLPNTRFGVAAYYVIASAECSSNLARFDGVHYGHRTATPRSPRENPTEHLYSASRSEGFGPEVKRRLMLGTFVLAAGYADKFYSRALQVRRLVQRDILRALDSVDILLGPTSPTPAFRIGEKTDDPLQMYLADVYTIAANLAGVPAISLPCGLSRSGLPIGLQMMAPLFAERRLLQAARLYERETDWHERRPPAAA
jgi:aspartyl-tRNA(Asn)/glutamyl-tRNA(Gln) amidotransferase subunit A